MQNFKSIHHMICILWDVQKFNEIWYLRGIELWHLKSSWDWTLVNKIILIEDMTSFNIINCYWLIDWLILLLYCCIHVSVSWNIIGSTFGLLPGQCQAIIWTNTDLLSIRSSATIFGEILTKIMKRSLKTIHLKMLCAKCPFCWLMFFTKSNVCQLISLTY